MSKIGTSLENTKELRELILNNPELPLLIFVGEEAYTGEFPCNMAEVNFVGIEELTVYKDFCIEKEEYKEQLIDDLGDVEEYKELSDIEYSRMIDQKVEEAEYIKAIVMYVG
ncbi:MAG: hypothetical protein HFJ09_08605 [Lachnospiraceae bacterium]|nr:hypothetical protein [Lachnospiraceae bacterium]